MPTEGHVLELCVTSWTEVCSVSVLLMVSLLLSAWGQWRVGALPAAGAAVYLTLVVGPAIPSAGLGSLALGPEALSWVRSGLFVLVSLALLAKTGRSGPEKGERSERTRGARADATP
jgi:hypothetical protein